MNTATEFLASTPTRLPLRLAEAVFVATASLLVVAIYLACA